MNKLTIDPFRYVLILLVLLTAGCAREPRQLSLAEGASAAEASPDEDEELRRLQEMQLVRYEDAETGEGATASAADLAEMIRPWDSLNLGGPCGDLVVCPGIPTPGGGQGLCLGGACAARRELCVARLLQSAALIRAQAIELDPEFFDPIRIPAQSSTTRAALLKQAYHIAKGALASVSSFASCDAAGDLPEQTLPWMTTTSAGPTAVSLFAETLLEAHRLTDELAADAVDALVGVADAQRSYSLEIQQGAARAISGAELSRAEAAHLLVGGDPGLMGSTSKAFCSSPELSGRARTALNVIRFAAPSPATVKGSSDMNTFLNASHAAFPEGSIGVRLALLEGRCNGSVCSPVNVQSETGISTEDFTQARNYLIQEIDAFARSSSVTFNPSRVGPPATLSGVAFYAATRLEPTAPPAEYYTALASYLKPGWAPPASGQLYGDLAHNLSAASTSIRAALPPLISLLKTSSAYPTQHQAVDGTVSALLSDDPRQGVLTRSKASGGSTTITVYGFSAADNLRLVAGLDGLLCATTGMVEGQPCSVVTYTATFFTNAAPSYGFTSAVRTTAFTLADSLTPLFLVRPMDTAELVPGGFEYLTGMVAMNTTVGTTYVHPIIPALDRKAGELLKPSTKWCTRSAVECDGTLFDERMPLENELSEDGDGVESSWRHYLGLAEQAAAEAHALGEAYISNGVEVDRQAEAAELRDIDDYQRFLSHADAEMETVQDICGTAMSTDALLELFGVNLASLAPNRAACTSDAQCCNPVSAPCAHTACVVNVCQATACTKDSQCRTGSQSTGFECIAGKCARSVEAVLDTPNKTESVSRLQECLGERVLAPYAILGTDPVCVWHETGNKNKVCHGSSEEYPCPAVPRYDVNGDPTCDGIKKPSNVTVGDPVSTFTTADGEEVPLTLGLIQSGEGIVTDTCVELRKLRHGLGSHEEICGRILEDEDYFIGFYDDEEAALVDSISAAFTFDSKGSRVDISLDEHLRWSTGGRGMAANRWPCAWHSFANEEECEETPNALFCQRVNCNATTNANEVKAVAQLNDRLIETAVLLKGLSRMDYERIVVPTTMALEDLEAQVGPLSPLQTHDRGAYLETSTQAAEWGRPITLTTFTDDPASSDALPIFYRHYTRAGVLPPGGNYSVSGDPAYVRALRSLPRESDTYRTDLSNLRRSAALCGDRSAKSFQDGMGDRLWGVENAPDHTLPWGEGLATDELLESGAVPDLPYLTKRFRYTDEGLQDVAELFCELSRGKLGVSVAAEDCPQVVLEDLQVPEDFTQVKALADCRVRDFERSLGRLVLPRIPLRVVQGIHESADGAFPIVGGKVGEQMHRLRAALVRFGELNSAMRDAGRDLRDTVDKMNLSVQAVGVRTAQESIDVEAAELRGVQARIRLEQIDFQQQAAWAAAAFECASGWLSGLATAYQSYGASILGSAIECERAHQSARTEAMNLNYERRITEVEQTIAQADQTRNELDLEYVAIEHARDLIEHRSAIRSQAGRMADLTKEGRAAIEEVFASLAELEGLRFKALRSLNRALQYQSSQAAVTKQIDQVLNAKLKVSKRRYKQAHDNAIRLAFLAKRAIEQRLGVHLSELRADLPLVDAPSSWEAEICTADGIDYEALREEDRGGGTARAFAQAYIGDYVGKLRNVVESYRLEHDFQEGTDEVVASVRDDVFHVKDMCDRALGNLLTYSGTFDHLTNDPALPGWKIYGCPTGANGVETSCFQVVKNVSTVPLLGDDALFGDAPVYDLSWDWSGLPTLGQRKTLEAGRYRVSWFTGSFGPLTDYHPILDVRLVDDATGTAIAPTPGGTPTKDRWPIALNGSWPRQYRIFDLEKKGDYRVELAENVQPSGMGLAGMMLEQLSPSDAHDDPSLLKPGVYVATQAEPTRQIPVCEDTDGSAFRAQAWTRRCERLCADGFTGSCNHGDGPEACFWETTIGLDQRDLDEGRILKQAGFARGNFNYRIESVALNFVGSGVRNCEDAPNPSTCYAGGFVSYSLKHLGPLYVRNHTGADFPVKLFTGNIEHARGLGVERYLTNPLSSTDRELITPYLRSEFQGRPLDGSFVLRVWEEPGVDFHAIQDVQLYVKYRYWTRFE